MKKTNFQDLSFGSKILLLLEFMFFSLLVIAGFYLNWALQVFEQEVIPSNILMVFAIVFAFTTQLSMLALGLYNPRMRENFRTVFRRLTVAFIIAYFISGIFLAVFSPFSVEIILLAVISVTGLLVTTSFRWFLNKYDLLEFGKRKILVLGAGERASIIEKRMRRNVDRKHFSLIGFMEMPGDRLDNGIRQEITYKLNEESEGLLEFVKRNKVDEIVVACDERRGNLPTEDLFACRIRGINVIEILDFIERETGQVAVNLIYPSWVIYSNGFSSSHYLRNSLDWIINATLGLFIFLFAFPFMLIAAIAIKLEDGLNAPIFYTQERVGLDGIPFRIVKFRSMRQDAEKEGAVWSAKNDSRVTRVGNFLRKYRIDELPQLYNVMRGDMGFVGPRPERPEFVTELALSIPYYNQRHNVKPGLTGWAQLKYPYGSTEEDARQKLHYDLYYIKHRSFLLDMHILMRTAEVVFFGKGR